MTTFAHLAEQRALRIGDIMCSARPQLAHLYADERDTGSRFSALDMFIARAG